MSKNNFLIIAVLFLMLFCAPRSALASRAGLVIGKNDGQIKTACIEFEQDFISGMALLKQSGFPIVEKDGFIISIDETASKDSSQMGGDDYFWSYWKMEEVWIFQNVGANYSVVRDGDVEGWSFGGGSSNLPSTKFSDICFEKNEITNLNLDDRLISAQSEKSQKDNLSADSDQGDTLPKTNDSKQFLVQASTTSLQTDLFDKQKNDLDYRETDEDQIAKNNSSNSNLVPRFNFKNLLLLGALIFLLMILTVFFKILASKRKRTQRSMQKKG